MENNFKIVNGKYCETCKYEDVHEEDDPCSECLCHPVNENSRKPVKWEEKK